MLGKFIKNKLYKLERARRAARILIADFFLPKNTSRLENGTIKIGIFKRGGIGDWIIYSKPLETLKNNNSNATITIYCEKRQRQIVELIALADRIIEITDNDRKRFSSRYNFLSKIRKENYDLWIDSDIARTNFGDAACLASQAKYRMGYAASQQAPCHKYIESRVFTDKLKDNLGKTHMLDRFEELLEHAANLTREKTCTQTGQKKFASGLSKYKWNGLKSNYFVVAPGASSEIRMWPAERFAGIITKMVKIHKLEPILIGSENDKHICKSIEILLEKEKVNNLSGTLTIDDLFRIICDSRILITNESGPMHIGRISETPTLALVSGADFESYPNYRKKTLLFDIVHSTDQSCFNCQWKCTHIDANKKTIKPCLDAVSTEMAWDKIEKILAVGVTQ